MIGPARYIARYLSEEVCGLQSPNTFEAKGRDLTAFASWFVDFNGHGHITDWQRQDTTAYLNVLEHERGQAPITVKRVLASLRHFAKGCHEQPAHVFETNGIPTRNDEPDCKKLTPKRCTRCLRRPTAWCAQAWARVRPSRNPPARPQPGSVRAGTKRRLGCLQKCDKSTLMGHFYNRTIYPVVVAMGLAWLLGMVMILLFERNRPPRPGPHASEVDCLH